MKLRCLKLFRNVAIEFLKDLEKFLAMLEIGPFESWQMDWSEEPPPELLVLFDDTFTGRKSCNDERCSCVIDQNLEPVRDVTHDLSLAAVVKMLELIKHDHPGPGFL